MVVLDPQIECEMSDLGKICKMMSAHPETSSGQQIIRSPKSDNSASCTT